MKRTTSQLLFAAMSASIACSAVAQDSTFTGAVDTDFNNNANWDNDAPGVQTPVAQFTLVPAGLTADLTADYLMANNGSPAVTTVYIDGTVNTGAFELQLRSGGVARQSIMAVGFNAGTNGVLNLDSGGRIDMAGVGADLFVGLVVGGGSGALNVMDGGTMQVQKTIEVLTGTLSFADGALYDGSFQDELVVSDTGTLAFEIDAVANTYLTLPAQHLQVELGETSTLDLSFSSAPTTGQSFDLIVDSSGTLVFGGVQSLGFQSGTGVFGNVNATGLASGQSIELTYGTDRLTASVVASGDPADLDGDGDVDDADFGIAFAAFTGPNNGPSSNPDADLDGDGDVDDADFGIAFAAFTGPGGAAVPEPASLALLGLGGLLVGRRRR